MIQATSHQQSFGLNLLFEALNDHARALKLQKFQGFDRKVFYALTAENDVFSIERIQNLSANIVYLNQTIQQLNDTLAGARPFHPAA